MSQLGTLPANIIEAFLVHVLDVVPPELLLALLLQHFVQTCLSQVFADNITTVDVAVA